MKIIAIGDTHGRDDWRNISIQNECDKLVFIGDYFDTHEDISPQQQISNFKDIIKLKESAPDEIVLLFGNHDFHYMRGITDQYSGYQPLYATDIQESIHDALKKELLQMCYVSGKFLFTHAGVTNTWCEANGIDQDNIEQSINDLFTYTPNAFRFTPGDHGNPYGDEICQTPIWVRPSSLYTDRVQDHIQIVGHTMQNKLYVSRRIIVDKQPVEISDIILIDTLGTSGEYLDITDGFVEIKATITQEVSE